MSYAIFVFVILIIIYGPQLWVSNILRKYSDKKYSENCRMTGSQYAFQLIKENSLQNVKVEIGEEDGYDPTKKTVYLKTDNYNNKSLIAITVAAHEIGHAIQHKAKHPMLEKREKIVDKVKTANTIGSFFIVFLSSGFFFGRSIMLVCLPLAFLAFLYPAYFHLKTLDLEDDASFKIALPILKKRLPEDACENAKKILTACKWTYVAQSLSSILSLGRLFFIFLRIFPK